MPKVSIVLPAYDAARTVGAAVRAMLGQSFADFELIVYDDGSADGTIEAVREASADDARVRVLHGPHLGVSRARNAGLDVATGEFVTFLDADDEPHAGWLSTLVSLAKGGADLAVCGYEVRDDASGTLQYSSLTAPGATDETLRLASDEFMCDLFSNARMYQGYVWNKLFRRELLEQSPSLRFQRGIAYNEDRLFVFWYLRRARTVAFSAKPCFTYHSHKASTAYRSERATEITAFDEVLADLVVAGPADALPYAEKDCFRALVELYADACLSGDPDQLWLGERVRELAGYADSFGAYPKAFRDVVDAAVGRAMASAV